MYKKALYLVLLPLFFLIVFLKHKSPLFDFFAEILNINLGFAVALHIYFIFYKNTSLKKD